MAKDPLEDAGFYVEFDAYDTPRTGVQHDTVTSMQPNAGALAPYGSSVVLDIFAEPVQVPDVVGLSVDEARTRLENARFKVGFDAYDAPKTGVHDGTVASTDPVAGTPAPFGSRVMLRVYVDNPTDSPAMSEEDWDRVRIGRKVEAEFGDRRGPTHWDETTATIHFQIADLSADDIDRLQSLYADEVYTVTFSAATVSRGELQALNRSTGDLIRAVFAECGTSPWSYGNGINVESWSVSVSWSVDDLEDQPKNECINEMKEVVLANAADFAKEHSILADPADLVRFVKHPPRSVGDFPHD